MKWLAVAVVLSLSIACSSKKSADGVDSAEALPIEQHHECAACGMVVAEQPAARAQLVHRDGTRQYFCSISDMLAYLGAPSPHGAVVSMYVETMDPKADPRILSVAPRPWTPADQASYVTGIEKRVMGRPIMVYATRGEASAIADEYNGTVMTWTEVRATAE